MECNAASPPSGPLQSLNGNTMSSLNDDARSLSPSPKRKRLKLSQPNNGRNANPNPFRPQSRSPPTNPTLSAQSQNHCKAQRPLHRIPSTADQIKRKHIEPTDIQQKRIRDRRGDYESKELSPSKSPNLEKPTESKKETATMTMRPQRAKKKKPRRVSSVNNLITNYLHHQSSMNYDKIIGTTNHSEERRKKRKKSKRAKSKRAQNPRANRSNSSNRSNRNGANPSYLAMTHWTPPSLSNVFDRLNHSRFRSKFKLFANEMEMVRSKGHVLERHAFDFVNGRLAAANPKNDGKQTPMRGHPVFIAQHATATCCRSCLSKWHHIPIGRAMTSEQRIYTVQVILRWIKLKGPNS